MWTQEQINEWREYIKVLEENAALQKTYIKHLKAVLKEKQKELDSGGITTAASEPPKPPPNPPGPPNP